MVVKVLVALFIFGNSLAAPLSEQEKNYYKKKGRVVLVKYRDELGLALKQSVQNGFIKGVRSCRAKKTSVEQNWRKLGYKIGRTSHRLRNPKNVAPAWVAPFISKYRKSSAKNKMPISVVALDVDRAGVIAPIYTKKMCMHCHGVSISQGVKSEIRKYYPKDQATGFTMGDLRGLFWLELKR